MKTATRFVPLVIALLLAGCSTHPLPPAPLQAAVVEAACGECQFGMKGKDCELAIRVQGQTWFVDGVDEKSLGDAHAADGICQTIRRARVTGEFKHGRFVATQFELLPVQPQ